MYFALTLLYMCVVHHHVCLAVVCASCFYRARHYRATSL